ncbi:MAG: hypothetical protein K0S58_2740 [Nitrospira sp.]|jgi:hypothetical protein|nr:hypothetical protein [Nitrospira sp.]
MKHGMLIPLPSNLSAVLVCHRARTVLGVYKHAPGSAVGNVRHGAAQFLAGRKPRGER